ncbi:MAG: hypothetical protein GX928_05980 [Ruminococcaceae bacterium]|nr:hypothetical protein [Oscillospiraceae bacterium]
MDCSVFFDRGIGPHYKSADDALAGNPKDILRIEEFDVVSGKDDLGNRKLPFSLDQNNEKVSFSCNVKIGKPEGFETFLFVDAEVKHLSCSINGETIFEAESSVIAYDFKIDCGDETNSEICLLLTPKEDGGCLREVYVYHLPKSSVTSLKMDSLVKEGDAGVILDITVASGDVAMSLGGALRVTIYFEDGNIAEKTLEVKPFKKQPWQRLRAKLIIESSELWSPKSPKYYCAVFEYIRSDGSVADVRKKYFGIRDLNISEDSVKDGAMTLRINSQRLKLRAAHFSQTIPTADEIFSKGFNSVYIEGEIPPGFLADCWKKGLMIIYAPKFSIELKRKWWQKRSDDDPLDNAVLSVGESVDILKSQTPVIIWSLGIKGAFGYESLANLVRIIDGTRPLCCEGDTRFTVGDFFAFADCGLSELSDIASGNSVPGGRRKRRIKAKDYMKMPLLLCAVSPDRKSFEEKFEIIERTPHMAGAVVNFTERLSSFYDF